MKSNAKFVEEHLVTQRRLHDGMTAQKIYKFPNNYGASIISGPYVYGGDKGLCELAVIVYNDSSDPDKWTLCYDTPITHDVIGYLIEEETIKILKQISKLPKTKEK